VVWHSEGATYENIAYEQFHQGTVHLNEGSEWQGLPLCYLRVAKWG